MGTRGKVLLGYVAIVVAGFGLVNFGLLALDRATPVSVAVSHPLAIVAMGYLAFAFVIPARLGLDVPRVLPLAGPDLATYRCVGRIGKVRVFRGQIMATVSADRLTLRPKFVNDYVIHGSDIRSITDESRMRQLVIEHAAPGSGSPVVLYRLPDDIIRLIQQIRRDPLSADLPAPASPEDRSARAATLHITMFAWGAGFVLGIVVAVVGVVLLADGPLLGLIAWILAMLFFFSLNVREFVRHYR